jgi:DNA-binding NarL/FixJ family response regulator
MVFKNNFILLLHALKHNNNKRFKKLFMKHSYPLIAIYDDDDFFRALLHHVIEQHEYQVAFSCCKMKELYAFLKEPPKALLLSGNGDINLILKNVRKIRKAYCKLKILIYTKAENNKLKAQCRKAGADSVITKCSYEEFLNELDNLCGNRVMPIQASQAKSISLKSDNIFSIIIKNKKKHQILKCLEKGFSSKVMESIVDAKSSTINFYIWEMCQLTNSHNRSELLGKAKDAHVI